MYWLALGIIFLALVYWYGVCKFSLLAKSPLTGPKPWPYVGNVPDIAKYGSLHKLYWEYFKRFGRVHKMFLGRSPAIVVNDPEIAKQILVKEFNKFTNRPALVKPQPPITTGLFVSRDETWRRIRALVSTTFTTGKMKDIAPIMEAAAGTMVKKVDALSSKGKNVDCISLFSLYALDVIMKAAFGYDSDVQTRPSKQLVQKARNVFNIPVWVRAFSMFPFADFLASVFGVQLLQNLDYFMHIAQNMIKTRQPEGAQGRKDLMQMMLEARHDGDKGSRTLSNEEIGAQSVTLLIAGFETTGTTLSCSAYFLATHPEVQDKLIAELDKARANKEDMPLYEFIRNQDYLERVISEVLRLCSPAFVHMRECKEDCVINGVYFPKGVDVHIPCYVMHRDPEAWENPEAFDPDLHFSPEATAKRHSGYYMPFGMGPRMCLGMRFAEMELKIGLMTVLEKFKFERVPQTMNLELDGMLLLRSKHPVILRLKRREEFDQEQ